MWSCGHVVFTCLKVFEGKPKMKGKKNRKNEANYIVEDESADKSSSPKFAHMCQD